MDIPTPEPRDGTDAVQELLPKTNAEQAPEAEQPAADINDEGTQNGPLQVTEADICRPERQGKQAERKPGKENCSSRANASPPQPTRSSSAPPTRATEPAVTQLDGSEEVADTSMIPTRPNSHPMKDDRIMSLSQATLDRLLTGTQSTVMHGRRSKTGPVWLASQGVIHGYGDIASAEEMTPDEINAQRVEGWHHGKAHKKSYGIRIHAIRRIEPLVPYFRPPRQSKWDRYIPMPKKRSRSPSSEGASGADVHSERKDRKVHEKEHKDAATQSEDSGRVASEAARSP
ncbi:unnamed protein product [Symbiodinium sp. CCMP2592]|nr:unnamed protein product [Symbiodinium sp. CCMP2592]